MSKELTWKSFLDAIALNSSSSPSLKLSKGIVTAVSAAFPELSADDVTAAAVHLRNEFGDFEQARNHNFYSCSIAAVIEKSRLSRTEQPAAKRQKVAAAPAASPDEARVIAVRCSLSTAVPRTVAGPVHASMAEIASSDAAHHLVIGPPGSGKSFLMRCLAARWQPAAVVYVDGSCFPTEQAVALYILSKMGVDVGTLSCMRPDQLALEFGRALREMNAPLYLILDRFESLARIAPRTLYVLFDASHAKQIPLRLFAVSSRLEVESLLEKRVKSRFIHRQILVEPPSSSDSICRILSSYLGETRTIFNFDVFFGKAPIRQFIDMNMAWGRNMHFFMSWFEYLLARYPHLEAGHAQFLRSIAGCPPALTTNDLAVLCALCKEEELVSSVQRLEQALRPHVAGLTKRIVLASVERLVGLGMVDGVKKNRVCRLSAQWAVTGNPAAEVRHWISTVANIPTGLLQFAGL